MIWDFRLPEKLSALYRLSWAVSAEVFFKHSRRCVSCSWGGYDVHVRGNGIPTRRRTYDQWYWNDGWWSHSDVIPQPAGLASKQDADNKPSYAFGSVTNTAAQGYPVPFFMESAVSVVQLFLQEFTLKTSNKNTSI
jgi:hypothetical protein